MSRKCARFWENVSSLWFIENQSTEFHTPHESHDLHTTNYYRVVKALLKDKVAFNNVEDQGVGELLYGVK